jgi:hypothetical protein
MSTENEAQDDPADEPHQDYAHERDLREEAENEVLGGADVEHCQRMRG